MFVVSCQWLRASINVICDLYLQLSVDSFGFKQIKYTLCMYVYLLQVTYTNMNDHDHFPKQNIVYFRLFDSNFLP